MRLGRVCFKLSAGSSSLQVFEPFLLGMVFKDSYTTPSWDLFIFLMVSWFLPYFDAYFVQSKPLLRSFACFEFSDIQA